ncbi:MAG: hypothetical protein Q8Q25_02225, partial [bacterium]|nr:hypothetical protein [bacterium]
EKVAIKNFLNGMAPTAQRDQALSYLEENRYDMTIKKLQKLGVNLQEKFNMTELRQKLIAQELAFDSIPLWASEISVLDYLFEKDQRIKTKKKNWATVKDKIDYFFVLADELKNGHQTIPDNQLYIIRDAAKTLEMKLSKALTDSPDEIRDPGLQKLIQIIKVQEERGIIKPEKPMGITPVKYPRQTPSIRYDPNAPTHTKEGHVIYY